MKQPGVYLAALLAVALTLSLNTLPLERPSAWAEGKYNQTPDAAFFQLKSLHRTMDLVHPDLPLLNAAIFYETNLRRMAQGMPPFVHLKALEQAAMDHAEEMAFMGYISHLSPTPELRHLEDRLKRMGIEFGWKGENIVKTTAYKYQEGRPLFPPALTGAGYRYELSGPDLMPLSYRDAAKEILDKWMNSPEHKENILRAEYTYLGCAAVIYRDKSFYDMEYLVAVQNFSSTLPKP